MDKRSITKVSHRQKPPGSGSGKVDPVRLSLLGSRIIIDIGEICINRLRLSRSEFDSLKLAIRLINKLESIDWVEGMRYMTVDGDTGNVFQHAGKPKPRPELGVWASPKEMVYVENLSGDFLSVFSWTDLIIEKKKGK